VNTTYYSNERVRSKKLIYKFSYEENLDVDAIFLNPAMTSHNYCDSKKITIMKKKMIKQKKKMNQETPKA
jgi:hypothetical protein